MRVTVMRPYWTNQSWPTPLSGDAALEPRRVLAAGEALRLALGLAAVDRLRGEGIVRKTVGEGDAARRRRGTRGLVLAAAATTAAADGLGGALLVAGATGP